MQKGNIKTKIVAASGLATIALGAVALASITLGGPVNAQDSRGSDVLRDCDVNIVRYTADHRVWFETNEGPDGLMYYMGIDGVSNENHVWGTKPTPCLLYTSPSPRDS